MPVLDPQFVTVLTLTSGVGAAMVWLAARLRTLDLRDKRRCPACGVLVERGRRCRCAD